MRTASGLTLIATGAILAFAVTSHPAFLNIQIAGWVVMLTGVTGMAIPARGYGWLRRRIVLRRGPDGKPLRRRVDEQRYPPYVMLNPGSGTAEPGAAAQGHRPGDLTAEPRVAAQARPPTGDERPPPAGDGLSPGEARLRPTEETVEEFFQE